MDSLECLKVFARVIELKSFSAVARERRVGQSTISKAIARLERNLDVRLIERTTTQLQPTEEGKRFYVRIKAILEEYAETMIETQGQKRQIAGSLRVNAPLGLGELRLNHLFVKFLKKFTQMEVELILNDRMIDLVEEGVDVAIRLGDKLPPNIIARKIAISPRILVASPAYLKRFATIKRAEDLTKHEHIRFAGIANSSKLTFSRGQKEIKVPAIGRYRINSSMALRQCFLDGVGLGTAPAWLVQDLIEDGSLKQILPEWRLPSQSAYVIYPTRRYQPARVRAAIDFLTESIPKLPGFTSIV